MRIICNLRIVFVFKIKNKVWGLDFYNFVTQIHILLLFNDGFRLTKNNGSVIFYGIAVHL